MRAFNRYRDKEETAPSRALLEAELERKNKTAWRMSAAQRPKQYASGAAIPNCPALTTQPASGGAFLTKTASAGDEAVVSKAQPVDGDQLARQESIVPYNGTHDDGYSWSQTAQEVTMQAFLPRGTRAKQVDVQFLPTKIKVGLRDQPPIIEGELMECVVVDDCTWNLEVANGELTITLEKKTDRWWKSVLVGAQEIDTAKVDSVKAIDEYDGETQGAIRKIMFDQQQKAKGLKSIEEMQQEELLRQAWDKPGSPFAGQEFDPAAVHWGGDKKEGLAINK